LEILIQKVPSYVPTEQRLCGIGYRGNPLACGLDEAAQIREEARSIDDCGRFRLDGLAALFAILWP